MWAMNKFIFFLILFATLVTVFMKFGKPDEKTPPMTDKPTDKLTSPNILGSTLGQSDSPGAQPEITQTPTAGAPTVSTTAQPDAAILHTTEGDITIKFNTGATPNTIANFLKLAQNNFYNGTIFHRVIKGFMIQGGDPQGNGSGGPGYSFADEPFEGEYTRGTVAMANAGPNTNGSQFFIMHQDNPLPKNYVIFGKVISGIETVDKIAEAPTVPGGEGSKPVNPAAIKTIDLISSGGVN